MIFKFFPIFILNIIFLLACDNSSEHILEKTNLTEGVFIVNEGNYTGNNGEISFYNKATGELVNNLFSINNSGNVLGDVVQSFGIADKYGFIVVNNSKKIEVVLMETFERQTTISGINYPRYWLTVGKKKAYLTNQSEQGLVYVINTEKFEIMDTITVGNQPENMVTINGKVFVANGAWGHDNTVSIIDIQTDKVIETVEVGEGTTDLIVDKNDNIQVLCQGKVIYDENWNIVSETESKIVTLNSEDFSTEHEKIIGQIGDNFNPTRLAVSNTGETLFFIEKNGVYSIDINFNKKSDLIISGDFYGLELEPENGNIYVFASNGFSGASKMFIYDKDNYKLITERTVGIGANGAVFR